MLLLLASPSAPNGARKALRPTHGGGGGGWRPLGPGPKCGILTGEHQNSGDISVYLIHVHPLQRILIADVICGCMISSRHIG